MRRPAGTANGGAGASSILDVETGGIIRLNDANDSRAAPIVAPDGKSFLLTGRSLRLFDGGGRLILDIAPPEGMIVLSAAWSPDAQRFIFVLAPADVSLL